MARSVERGGKPPGSRFLQPSFRVVCRGRRTGVLHCEHSWPATPEHVRDARACVTQLAQRAGLSFESLEGVRLAVSEAVANVVVHGYRDGDVGRVTVAA